MWWGDCSKPLAFFLFGKVFFAQGETNGVFQTAFFRVACLEGGQDPESRSRIKLLQADAFFLAFFLLPLAGSSSVPGQGQESEKRRLEQELIFGKGMRTATFQFSESGGSRNGPDLFTELPFL